MTVLLAIVGALGILALVMSRASARSTRRVTGNGDSSGMAWFDGGGSSSDASCGDSGGDGGGGGCGDGGGGGGGGD